MQGTGLAIAHHPNAGFIEKGEKLAEAGSGVQMHSLGMLSPHFCFSILRCCFTAGFSAVLSRQPEHRIYILGRIFIRGCDPENCSYHVGTDLRCLAYAVLGAGIADDSI